MFMANNLSFTRFMKPLFLLLYFTTPLRVGHLWFMNEMWRQNRLVD